MKYRHTIIFGIALIMICICSAVQAQTIFTPFTYSVGFTIKNAGITVDGSLKGLQGNICFAPGQLETSKLSASMEVNSINTGNRTRDNHLKADDYFNAAKFPLISLSSVKLYKQGEGFAGLFVLTIKDKSKQLEIPFTYAEKDEQATFEAKFAIDRRDFDVGGYSLVLSDEVNIHILVNAKK